VIRIRCLLLLLGAFTLLTVAGCMQDYSAPIVSANDQQQVVDLAQVKPVNVENPNVENPNEHHQVYVVQRGDTLAGIAGRYHMSYVRIARFNRIEAPYTIHAGEKLMIPGEHAQLPPLPQPHHVVAVQKPPVQNVAQPQVAQASPAGPQVQSYPQERDVSGIAWSWPVAGKVTQDFSGSGDKDIVLAPSHDLIKAAASGVVVYAGSDLNGNGQMVIIKHKGAYLTAYSHNQTLLVKQGQQVTRGQDIAKVGTGATIQFQIRHLGKPVDPTAYLPQRG